MIHRDYVLRMIEEFMRVLSAIRFLKQSKRWKELEGTLDEQFQKLAGTDAVGALGLSETELAARLMQGEATLVVQHKTRFIIRLFKEAGDAAVAQDSREQAKAFYVRGLELLLQDTDVDASFTPPDFFPRVEAFTEALAGEPLPARTTALLMEFYERAGMFARAEDTLFDLLEDMGNNREVLDFGIAFYERLRGKSDPVLMAGDLPRSEVETGLAEVQARKAGLDPR